MSSSTFNPLDTFDHVVVLMLENRSFDNLLGYLYKDKPVPPGKSFAGLQEGNHCIPTTPTFQKPEGDDVGQAPPISQSGPAIQDTICVHPATDYHMPFPDPGEVYRHVNTQIFNYVSERNWAVDEKKMCPPYNVPNGPYNPTMTGFVSDYRSTLIALYKEYGKKDHTLLDLNGFKQIMACFEPEMVKVMRDLANNFAVFDHWHCSVPSQTWCNRSFWHAGTSGGRVSNGPLHWWKASNQPTLFNQLHHKKISWNIYTDNLAALAGIIHFRALLPYHLTHFHSYKKFKEHITSKKDKLPAYSFIEPRFWTPHNDQHPSAYGEKHYEPSPVGSVLMGEHLIYDVYETIRNSRYKDRTLLIITHDEHGGCYDHVKPPKAHNPGGGFAGEDGFGFDRLGVRVPMIMVSSHIAPNTIMNETYDHTSFLNTMHEKWNLDALTERDAHANNFKHVFTPEKRDWPALEEPHLNPEWIQVDYSGHPLNDLQKSMLEGIHIFNALQKQEDLTPAPEIKTQREAIDYLRKQSPLPGADYAELTIQH